MTVSTSNIKAFDFPPDDVLLPGKRLTRVSFSSGDDTGIEQVGVYFNYVRVSSELFDALFKDFQQNIALRDVELDYSVAEGKTGILFNLKDSALDKKSVMASVFTALKDNDALSGENYNEVMSVINAPVRRLRAIPFPLVQHKA